MKDFETLIDIWKDTDIEKNSSFNINFNEIKNMQAMKSKNQLKSYLWLNIFSLIVGLGFLSFSFSFIVNTANSESLIISGLVLMAFALTVSVYSVLQTLRIVRLDYTQSVFDIQRQLQSIRLSALRHLRICLVFLPLYPAYLLVFGKLVFNIDLWEVGDKNWLIVQGGIMVAVLAACTWLNTKLSPANIDKPYVRRIMQGCGSQVIDTLKDWGELDQFTEKRQ